MKAIAKEAHARGASIREIALERTDLEPDRLDALLDARSMTEPSAKAVSGPGRRKSASSGKSKKKTKKANQKPTAKTKSAAGRKPSKESKR